MNKAKLLIEAVDKVNKRHFERQFDAKAKALKLDKVGKEVLMAYCDAFKDELGPDVMDFRDLHFKSSESVNGKKFIELSNLMGPYNNFDTEVATKVVATFGNNAEYWPAREGSATVYVKPQKADLGLEVGHNHHKAQELFKADELSLDKGTYRIWWD